MAAAMTVNGISLPTRLVIVNSTTHVLPITFSSYATSAARNYLETATVIQRTHSQRWKGKLI
jgi:hypothetical protein